MWSIIVNSIVKVMPEKNKFRESYMKYEPSPSMNLAVS